MKKEREILQESIRAHKSAIEKAERELAELDKPKLRHGEIRHWPSACKTFYGGNLCGMVDLSGGEVHVVWLCAARNNIKRACKSEEDILRTSKHVSYMMDDIAARNEELERFTHWTKAGGKGSMEIAAVGSYVRFEVTNGSGCKLKTFTVGEAQAIVDDAQKVINFARNK